MTKKEQIKMAIWMLNKLIDKYPVIYKYLKDEYLEEKNER